MLFQKKAGFTQRAFQVFSGNRLQQIIKYALTQSFLSVFKISIARQDNSQDMRVTFVHVFGKSQAVHNRHADICDDEMDIFRTKSLQRRLSVRNLTDYFVAGVQRFDMPGKGLTEKDLVLDQHNIVMFNLLHGNVLLR